MDCYEIWNRHSRPLKVKVIWVIVWLLMTSESACWYFCFRVKCLDNFGLFCSEVCFIHVSIGMNPADFDHSLTFHVAPPWGHYFQFLPYFGVWLNTSKTKDISISFSSTLCLLFILNDNVQTHWTKMVIGVGLGRKNQPCSSWPRPASQALTIGKTPLLLLFCCFSMPDYQSLTKVNTTVRLLALLFWACWYADHLFTITAAPK